MPNGSRYMAYSPSPSAPHFAAAAAASSGGIRPFSLVEQEKCLSESLAERNKLHRFTAVLPNCYRLLNQEILRVTTMLGSASVLEQSGFERASPLASGGLYPNGGANTNRWPSPFHSEMSGLIQPSSTPN